jgi:hypothetical protein
MISVKNNMLESGKNLIQLINMLLVGGFGMKLFKVGI